MYKKNLALNNLQWLICHKTELNQTKYFFLFLKFRQGHLTMVVVLMSYGADPSLRDGEGNLKKMFCILFPFNLQWV